MNQEWVFVALMGHANDLGKLISTEGLITLERPNGQIVRYGHGAIYSLEAVTQEEAEAIASHGCGVTRDIPRHMLTKYDPEETPF